MENENNVNQPEDQNLSGSDQSSGNDEGASCSSSGGSLKTVILIMVIILCCAVAARSFFKCKQGTGGAYCSSGTDLKSCPIDAFTAGPNCASADFAADKKTCSISKFQQEAADPNKPRGECPLTD